MRLRPVLALAVIGALASAGLAEPAAADPPVAQNYYDDLLVDDLLVGSTLDLTQYDFNVEITAVGNASHGVVTLVGDTWTFVPEADFNGQADFEFTVANGEGSDVGDG